MARDVYLRNPSQAETSVSDRLAELEKDQAALQAALVKRDAALAGEIAAEKEKASPAARTE